MTTTNRRDFIKNATLASAGSLLGGQLMVAGCASKTTKKRLGIQTYSVGNDLSADIPKGLAMLAEMGYTDLEVFGYSDGKIGEVGVVDYRKMAEDAGLVIVGSHVNPPIRQYSAEYLPQFEEFWKKASEDHFKLGVNFVVQPSMPNANDYDAAKYVCDIFNSAGNIAKEAGLLWGYHNHSGEFNRLASKNQIEAEEKIVAELRAQQGENARIPRRPPVGDYIEDIFITGTDPDLVLFELDVYWAVMGQQDPLAWLNKYPDRFKLLHIKDAYVVGGSGLINWENIFNKGYDIGVLGYYVEIEGSGDISKFEAARESANYLINAPFVR